MAAAAALLEKCALLSSRHWAGAAAAHARSHALRLRSEELVELDHHAYLDYVAAIRSASGLTGRARAQAVAPAAATTVDVPLEIVQAAAEVVELAERLATHGNPRLRADAVVAAMLASAAAASGAHLVGVNLGPGTKDARRAEARRLARLASARTRPLAAPPRSGGRGRGPARSPGTGRP